ncbi:MAG: hypothetical protein KDD33_05490 [Bdellovibrionales bacterium]|nr:hypothetical protein [Bdellovibrionales bacterium]
MHSASYYLSKTPGLRKGLQWWTSYRIHSYKKREDERLFKNPKNLRNFEKKIYSQNGEDGIIAEIFDRIGTTNRFFVEFGFEDGQECNGRHLLENQGWSGLWIDGNVDSIAKARERFGNSSVNISHSFITKDNIKGLFQEHQVPKELDLLSIDIDGNDYWIWQALKDYKARLVVIEYNASFPPPREYIMPYNQDHYFDGSNVFGASLTSLVKLAEELGYVLVSCDNQGVNAFFVREDLIDNHFPDAQQEASYHYCAPKYRKLFFGHPPGRGPWRS